MEGRSDGSLDGVFDHDVDVVVVGAGAAGFAAAITAEREGAGVLLLDRADRPGGTTAKAGGTAWIPNNHLMRQHGVPDDRHEALAYLARTAYPDRFDPGDGRFGVGAADFDLLAAFYDHGPAAIEYLVDAGATEVDFDPITPDYSAELPENRAPRGRRVPQRLLPGGTHGGPLLIDRFTDYCQRRGLPVATGHRVVGVLRNDDGAVVGVEAHVGRRTVVARARRGVVFATGGFTHDVDLRRQYLRGPIFGGCAAGTATGDFVRIGLSVGAQLGNMSHAWWTEVVLEHALRTPEVATGVSFPFGDAMVHVNRFGRRVVDEKAPYNERAQVHFEWDPRRLEYPNLLLFHVYDDTVANDPTPSRRPLPQPGEQVDYVVSGHTFAELAANLDARLAQLAPHTGRARLASGFADNLAATVDRFNGFAAAGRDDDFGRGTIPISQHWNEPKRAGWPDPTMRPFAATGPYHCIVLAPGALDTKGGPRTDGHGRVLAVDGQPIPGLYGAGNCVASAAGQGYWGAGGTIGPALTFGYLAGRHAAHEKEHPLA